NPATAAGMVPPGVLPDPRSGVPLSDRAEPTPGRPGGSGLAVGALRLRAAGGAGRGLISAGGAARACVPREERQSLAMAPVSLGPLRRAGGRPERPVLRAVRLVPLRRGESHDLRAVFPGPYRTGRQLGLARDRDRLGPAAG